MREHPVPRRPESVPVLVFSLLAVVTFGTLYFARHLDDNRLTSWQWSFSHLHPGAIAVLIAASCVVAYFAGRSLLPDRHPLLFLVLLSYGAGAFFWGEPEVIVDSARYFIQAKHLEINGIVSFLREWGGAVPAWTDLPLLPFLYGLLFSLFGESRIWIQLFTTALFSLTVAATYLTGRTLWDEDVGISAGLLLLGMPYLYTQVPLMLVDVGTMCFFTLAVLAVILAFQRESRFFLLAAPFAVTFALLSKYSTWPLLTVLAVVLAARLSEIRREKNESGALPDSYPFLGTETQRMQTRSALFRAACISGGTAILAGAVLFSFHTVVADQIKLLLEYQRPGLSRWREGVVSTFLFQVHPFITTAALFSFYPAVLKRDPRYLIICWTVLLLLVLRIERIRYLITAFPLLALMAAYGIREIEGRLQRRFLAYSIVIGALIVAGGAYLPFLKTVSTVNLKEAGEYFDAIGARAVNVYTLPDEMHVLDPAVYVPILDLHTGATIRYHTPRDDAARDDPALREMISALPLRFTWELRLPSFYKTETIQGRDEAPLIAIISNAADQRLSQGLKKKLRDYELVKSFASDEHVYQAKSFVTIYRRMIPRDR